MSDSQKTQSLYQRFLELLELSEDERGRRLREITAEDSEFGYELSSMLRAKQAADENGFLTFSFSKSNPTASMFDQEETAKSSSIPTILGDYRIVDQLGSGGMGVVYRAYHPQTDRLVALKLIRSGELSSPEQIERFRGEARAAAQLKHPNIVPVFEVGCDNGFDFFTMALVEGESLQDILEKETPGQHRVARMFVRLARAVDYAHSKGVIHRDIKPANIMIDEAGEPQLTDFGLAKRINVDESRTRSGQILGTARFMAPEQITSSKDADERTDVYGLGATMYQSIVGAPPFPSGDLLEVFENIQSRMPASPRTIDPSIDADLDSICMKCLQKDRDDRYQGADQLADDLDRYLANEPLGNSGSAWRRSVSRVISHQESYRDLPSARAAWWIAILTLVIHSSIFLNFWSNLNNHIMLWLTLVVWIVGLSCINYTFHWSRFWHLTKAERQSGIVQLATLVAFLCLFFIHGPLTNQEPLSNFLAIYPPYCLVLGVALAAHVGFTGRALLQGSILFPLSIFLAFYPDMGPLAFAVLGALICIAFYRELRNTVERTNSEFRHDS